MDEHELRKNIDELILVTETREYESIEANRALQLVKTKLQEAKMWTGKILEAKGKELPNEFRDHCESRDNRTTTTSKYTQTCESLPHEEVITNNNIEDKLND